MGSPPISAKFEKQSVCLGFSIIPELFIIVHNFVVRIYYVVIICRTFDGPCCPPGIRRLPGLLLVDLAEHLIGYLSQFSVAALMASTRWIQAFLAASTSASIFALSAALSCRPVPSGFLCIVDQGIGIVPGFHFFLRFVFFCITLGFLTAFSISSSDRLVEAVMVIFCSLPVPDPGRYIDDSIGINVKGYLNLRNASGSRRNSGKRESAQGLVVGSHFLSPAAHGSPHWSDHRQP